MSLAASLYFLLNPLGIAQEKKETENQSIEQITEKETKKLDPRFKGHEEKLKNLYIDLAMTPDTGLVDLGYMPELIKKIAKEEPWVDRVLKERAPQMYDLIMSEKPLIDFNEPKYTSLDRRSFENKYLPSLKAALVQEGEKCSLNTDPVRAYKLLNNCGVYLLQAEEDVFKQNIQGYLSSAEQYGIPLIERELKKSKINLEQLDKLKKTIKWVKEKQNFYSQHSLNKPKEN